MNKTHLKKSKIHGHGVFASQDIKRGTLLESCPYLVLPTGNFSGKLDQYVFHYKSDKYILCLGIGSVFNHNDEPSAKNTLYEKHKEMRFYATRDIKKGEEITIDYGKQYWRAYGKP